MRSFILSAVFTLLLTGAALAEEGFTSLFNGKDLTGWTVKGGFASYAVEDGVIVGKCAPGTPGNTFLCTEKEYSNFILRLEVRYVVMGNSGVQVRSHARPRGERESVYGYQCEIADRVAVGQIYDEGRRAWGYSSKFRGLKRPDDWFSADAPWAFRKDEWNLVEIQCLGPSIRTWINGVPCANMIDVLDESGFIGLQVHAGSAGTLQWRDLEIRELSAPEWKKIDSGIEKLGDFVLRAKVSKETALALCGSEEEKKFVKDGENFCVLALIGDRCVLNFNDREVRDVNDSTAVAAMRETLAKVSANISGEVMEIDAEMKAQLER